MEITRKFKWWLIVGVGLVICIIGASTFILQKHVGLPLSASEIRSLAKAGEDGDAEACWALYLYYVDNKKEEAYWLQKAAGYGYAEAQEHLAARLRFGPDNETRLKALKLMEKAAAQNYAGAQQALAFWYRDGTIVERNLKTFEYWTRKAATNGLIPAMLDLAKFLLDTHDTYGALVEAYKWTTIASTRAGSESGYAIRARRTQDQIAEKALKIGLDVPELTRDAESQAVKLVGQIPVDIDPIKAQSILLKRIREKYGK